MPNRSRISYFRTPFRHLFNILNGSRQPQVATGDSRRLQETQNQPKYFEMQNFCESYLPEGVPPTRGPKWPNVTFCHRGIYCFGAAPKTWKKLTAQMAPNGPGAFTWHSVFQNGYAKWLQEAPNGSRWLQLYPDGCRMYTWLQAAPRGPRRLQKARSI